MGSWYGVVEHMEERGLQMGCREGRGGGNNGGRGSKKEMERQREQSLKKRMRSTSKTTKVWKVTLLSDCFCACLCATDRGLHYWKPHSPRHLRQWLINEKRWKESSRGRKGIWGKEGSIKKRHEGIYKREKEGWTESEISAEDQFSLSASALFLLLFVSVSPSLLFIILSCHLTLSLSVSAGSLHPLPSVSPSHSVSDSRQCWM